MEQNNLQLKTTGVESLCHRIYACRIQVDNGENFYLTMQEAGQLYEWGFLDKDNVTIVLTPAVNRELAGLWN
jgi:alpha-tubulin suppressor-like RCC1 family protein